MNEADPALLANCDAPATEADAHALLERLQIPYSTHHHAAVFTVEEAKALRGDAAGSHIKNLFLRNKKGAMWVVTCHEDRQIDLKQLAQHLGTNRLSFASKERMMLYLGVTPGAVTPLAAMNDHGQVVTMVLDNAVLQDDIINVHPLHNAATTIVAPADLVRFLEAVGHAPIIIDMEPISSL
jgi:Ala-tRNA(Pro) deacylase